MIFMNFINFFKAIKKIIFRRNIPPALQSENFLKNISRKGIKDCFTGDDTLSISGKQKIIKDDINKEAKSIIKKSIESPEMLLDYVESKGTVIIKSAYMDRILKFFGEKEGFIPPITGIRAMALIVAINFVSKTKLKLDFRTPPMFALNDNPVNIYTISHQFHLWMSYINELPGFEEKNMKNFRDFWEEGPESKDISFLAVNDILSLKDIIAREMEALDFVREMAREFIGQKNSIKKIREGKSVNI